MPCLLWMRLQEMGHDKITRSYCKLSFNRDSGIPFIFAVNWFGTNVFRDCAIHITKSSYKYIANNWFSMRVLSIYTFEHMG